MTNHRALAESLVDRANHYSYGDGADPVTGTALATEGIVHAILSVSEQLHQLLAAQAPATPDAEHLRQQFARLTEQSDLWHRGELDTATAMAGIHGELHGVQLPEVGEWDRARAAEQAARDQAAAETAVGHCPRHLRFPCGHCAHDLCAEEAAQPETD